MIYAGKNIRKIRNVKGLSQGAFAEIFGIKRANIGAYEEGRANPKIELLAKIAKYFSISVEALTMRELSVNELSQFPSIDLEEGLGHFKSHTTSYGIPFISITNFGLYLKQLEQEADFSRFPSTYMPSNRYTIKRVFEVNGNGMLQDGFGFGHGDWIGVAEIELDTLTKDTAYVFILEKEMIVGRFNSIEKQLLTITFDNPNEENLEIKISSITEVWKIVKWVTESLPRKNSLHERIANLENKKL